MKQSIALLGSINSELEILQLDQKAEIQQVTITTNQIYILTSYKKLYTIGPKEFSGDLNLNSLLSYAPLEKFTYDQERIVQITCNNQVVHCINENGEVLTWGNDQMQYGILGLGDISEVLQPRKNTVLQGQKIKQISCGQKHVGCIDEQGHLFVWGSGNSGELGKAGAIKMNNPEQLYLNQKCLKCVCSNQCSCIITVNNNLIFYGILSNFSTENSCKSNQFYDCIIGKGFAIARTKQRQFLHIYNIVDLENLFQSQGKAISIICEINPSIYSLQFCNNDNSELLAFMFFGEQDTNYPFLQQVSKIIQLLNADDSLNYTQKKCLDNNFIKSIQGIAKNITDRAPIANSCYASKASKKGQLTQFVNQIFSPTISLFDSNSNASRKQAHTSASFNEKINKLKTLNFSNFQMQKLKISLQKSVEIQEISLEPYSNKQKSNRMIDRELIMNREISGINKFNTNLPRLKNFLITDILKPAKTTIQLTENSYTAFVSNSVTLPSNQVSPSKNSYLSKKIQSPNNQPKGFVMFDQEKKKRKNANLNLANSIFKLQEFKPQISLVSQETQHSYKLQTIKQNFLYNLKHLSKRSPTKKDQINYPLLNSSAKQSQSLYQSIELPQQIKQLVPHITTIKLPETNNEAIINYQFKKQEEQFLQPLGQKTLEEMANLCLEEENEIKNLQPLGQKTLEEMANLSLDEEREVKIEGINYDTNFLKQKQQNFTKMIEIIKEKILNKLVGVSIQKIKEYSLEQYKLKVMTNCIACLDLFSKLRNKTMLFFQIFLIYFTRQNAFELIKDFSKQQMLIQQQELKNQIESFKTQKLKIIFSKINRRKNENEYYCFQKLIAWKYHKLNQIEKMKSIMPQFIITMKKLINQKPFYRIKLMANIKFLADQQRVQKHTPAEIYYHQHAIVAGIFNVFELTQKLIQRKILIGFYKIYQLYKELKEKTQLEEFQQLQQQLNQKSNIKGFDLNINVIIPENSSLRNANRSVASEERSQIEETKTMGTIGDEEGKKNEEDDISYLSQNEPKALRLRKPKSKPPIPKATTKPQNQQVNSAKGLVQGQTPKNQLSKFSSQTPKNYSSALQQTVFRQGSQRNVVRKNSNDDKKQGLNKQESMDKLKKESKQVGKQEQASKPKEYHKKLST